MVGPVKACIKPGVSDRGVLESEPKILSILIQHELRPRKKVRRFPAVERQHRPHVYPIPPSVMFRDGPPRRFVQSHGYRTMAEKWNTELGIVNDVRTLAPCCQRHGELVPKQFVPRRQQQFLCVGKIREAAKMFRLLVEK